MKETYKLSRLRRQASQAGYSLPLQLPHNFEVLYLQIHLYKFLKFPQPCDNQQLNNRREANSWKTNLVSYHLHLFLIYIMIK